MQFPLRNGSYLAQVVIPSDMTKAEAERLSAFVSSLAMPESDQAASVDLAKASGSNEQEPAQGTAI